MNIVKYMSLIRYTDGTRHFQQLGWAQYTFAIFPVDAQHFVIFHKLRVGRLIIMKDVQLSRHIFL